jgi:hypothetical protein
MLSTTVLVALSIVAAIFMIMGLVVLADKGTVTSIWEKKVPGALLIPRMYHRHNWLMVACKKGAG